MYAARCGTLSIDHTNESANLAINIPKLYRKSFNLPPADHREARNRYVRTGETDSEADTQQFNLPRSGLVSFLIENECISSDN